MMTRQQKELVRTYALNQERQKGIEVAKVRLFDGDAIAYCKDGERYRIAPIDVLLAEAASSKSA